MSETPSTIVLLSAAKNSPLHALRRSVRVGQLLSAIGLACRGSVLLILLLAVPPRPLFRRLLEALGLDPECVDLLHGLGRVLLGFHFESELGVVLLARDLKWITRNGEADLAVGRGLRRPARRELAARGAGFDALDVHERHDAGALALRRLPRERER